MRRRFEEQLETLHVELITMGALCEDAIAAAMKALFDGDQSCAVAAGEAERAIDQKERDIEALCLRLLLQQQPVAGDLRRVSAALRLIADMERIGDQAADIAEITRHIADRDAPHRVPLRDMALAAIRMVTDSVDAYVRQDEALARAVLAADEVVDGLFVAVKEQLAARIAADHADGGVCIDLLMVAKYLERIGDHATNIAEWVVYAITGRHPDEKEDACP